MDPLSEVGSCFVMLLSVWFVFAGPSAHFPRCAACFVLLSCISFGSVLCVVVVTCLLSSGVSVVPSWVLVCGSGFSSARVLSEYSSCFSCCLYVCG